MARPSFHLFREALPGLELRGFRGILNSCTNMILTRMEMGETFDEAVEYGRKIGITETDPSADVDGWDAAIKVAALTTVLMDIPMLPGEVSRQGIRLITPEMILDAKQQGKRWKLVCTAKKDNGKVTCHSRPRNGFTGLPVIQHQWHQLLRPIRDGFPAGIGDRRI